MKRVIAVAGWALTGMLSLSTWAAAPEPGAAEFVVGNDLWQPGTRYRSGTDWLALICTVESCRFEPAALEVRPESWQGHYDEEPTTGQQLRFRRTAATAGEVIAWFRVNPERAWSVPGPVTTYASSAAPLKRPSTPGTFEVAVDLPAAGQARLVPLLDGSTFRLQLRAHGKRQMLGELGACSHEITTDYFLWAGDLERDGKPDYLISFVDADGQVVLYLSSAAAIAPPAEMEQPAEIAEPAKVVEPAGTAELVGIGGVYDAPPFGGECDGSGWLE